MEFSHLVVGCAAVLRGAEPISLSNGLYHPPCTYIYNPETNPPPKMPISNVHLLVFICLRCLCVHVHVQLVIAGTLASSVAQMVEPLLLQGLLVQSPAPHVDTCALEQSAEA